MSHKPKQWVLTSESEKFKVFHYEVGEGSNSGLWIDLRWSIRARTLCVVHVSFRSNALDDGAVWVLFTRSIRHHAVATRQAFEAIAWASVPLATVHQTACSSIS